MQDDLGTMGRGFKHRAVQRWISAVGALVISGGLPVAVAIPGNADVITSKNVELQGQSAVGDLSGEQINALMEEAEKLRASARYREAAQIWERLLKFAEATYGRDHPNTATSLNNLAGLYSSQGLYIQAEPLFQRALSITEKAQGHDHPNTVNSLNNLAGLYVQQGLYSRARPLLKRALSIREKTLGPDHPSTAISLNNMASLYSEQGLYGEAEPLLQRTYRIFEKALGPDHPNTGSSLNNLAGLYSRQGLYGQAEPFFKRALAIREKALGPTHPDTANSLNNLAGLYIREGLYSQAEPLLQRALNILKSVLGPDHPSTATSLNNLASLSSKQGLYSQAELNYQRALAITEKALGPDHPDTANSLNNLATLYNSHGFNSQAEPLLKRALAIREDSLGTDHPDTAVSLNNLAFLYSNQGLYSQAEPLYQRALAISEKALGLDHPSTAISLDNLAGLYSNQGLYSQAKPLLKRALAIRENALGSDHPDTAASLNSLAFVYSNRGRSSQAEGLLVRALAIREKALGPDHLDVAASLNNLAAEYIQNGKYSHASSYLPRGLSIQANWMVREGLLQPRSQRLALMSSLDGGSQAVFSITNRTPEGPLIALKSRLLRHGLLLEIEQAQASLSRAPGPTQELAQRVTALNTRISDVQLPPAQREVLRKQRNNLEQQLFRQWPDLKIPPITVAEAAAALPTDGVLVEFQRYRPWIGGAVSAKRWGAARYLALILKPDGTIRSVPLGESESIEQAITTGIQASAEGMADATEHWAAFSELLLKPLELHIQGSRQLFLSLDGELHRVPFAALPSPSRPGVPLASVMQLRLLTTGRDLVRFQKPVPSGSSPVVLANPNFESGRSATASMIASTQSQQRSGDLGQRRWDSLPGTAREGEQIANLLGAKPISGDAATVRVLQRSIGPRILHIASHGFFVGDQDIPPLDPLRASLAGGGQVARFQGEDPLLRSGIVLAGANNPGLDPNDDGLLTALEATALQLDGTELVVLSACSTGSGDIQSGEGLYGLQRALTVAGARSTLLSLWKVDDAATAEFMVRFYRRLKAGEGRADALAAVQAEFHKGLVPSPSGEDWSRPYYWAAWQLVGDWRPIEGL